MEYLVMKRLYLILPYFASAEELGRMASGERWKNQETPPSTRSSSKEIEEQKKSSELSRCDQHAVQAAKLQGR